MTLLITEENRAAGRVIALHGWLHAGEVDEVERVVASQPTSLCIELGALAGCDAAGLLVLRRLQQRGARLTGASPFLELLLQRGGEADVDPARRGPSGGER